MRNFLLVFICFFSSISMILAQREVDLQITMTSPVQDAQIPIIEQFIVTLELKNMGSVPFEATDSIALYMLFNGDTIPVMNDNYILLTGISLNSQEVHLINRPAIFTQGFEGANIDICFSVEVFNSVASLTDVVEENNISCAGISVIDQVASVLEQGMEQWGIYPNPVHKKFLVKGPNVSKIEVFDNAGKIVLSQTSELAEVDCSSLLNGMYFINIITDQGQVTRKMLVSK